MQDHWDAAAEAAYEALVPTTANSGSREARGGPAPWPRAGAAASPKHSTEDMSAGRLAVARVDSAHVLHCKPRARKSPPPHASCAYCIGKTGGCCRGDLENLLKISRGERDLGTSRVGRRAITLDVRQLAIPVTSWQGGGRAPCDTLRCPPAPRRTLRAFQSGKFAPRPNRSLPRLVMLQFLHEITDPKMERVTRPLRGFTLAPEVSSHPCRDDRPPPRRAGARPHRPITGSRAFFSVRRRSRFYLFLEQARSSTSVVDPGGG